MKQFTIEVSHASGPQLQTIAAELKIMSHSWQKFGPRITIDNKKLQALVSKRTKAQAASFKPQAPQFDQIYIVNKLYVKERSERNNRRAVSSRQDA